MFGLDTGLFILLIVCILAAAAFEFINGFHDTANAVATVIYTRSLKPRTAVIWSGFWNFIGVYFGGIAVAMGIVNLLPLEALIDQNISHNIAMILSLIITAIIWNLGTWYFGIPCSSSHTLLGSIFGVGLAFMFISPDGEIALNWAKVADAGLSLVISPLFGFGLALFLMIVFKRLIKKKKFFIPADPNKKPPFWIRGVLILTCTSVSYSHGSNDGQKGIGLMMIILIGILPAYFAINPSKNPTNMIGNVKQIELTLSKIDTTKLDNYLAKELKVVNTNIYTLKNTLDNSFGLEQIPEKQRYETRKNILSIAKITDLILNHKEQISLKEQEISLVKKNIKELKSYTEFAPWWVVLIISVSLGLGTMIGWKRIVVTIGEKIGKTHLSYAQGASAEIVAASTIGVSTALGLPVSTTHVLSSGIAGSMVSEGGLKNLQYKTIKNILIAWAVTLPVTILLSGSLFLFLRLFLD